MFRFSQGRVYFLTYSHVGCNLQSCKVGVVWPHLGFRAGMPQLPMDNGNPPLQGSIAHCCNRLGPGGQLAGGWVEGTLRPTMSMEPESPALGHRQPPRSRNTQSLSKLQGQAVAIQEAVPEKGHRQITLKIDLG